MQVQGSRARIYVANLGPDGNRTSFGYFAVKTYSASDEAEGLDVSNTEGRRGGGGGVTGGVGNSNQGVAQPGDGALGVTGWVRSGYKSKTPGQKDAKIELAMATFITDVGANPFFTPFSFESAKYVAVKIFPNRNSSGGHWFPYALITSLKHEGEVGGLQPVSLTLESDGDYYLYTGAGPGPVAG